jgi:hypothetical protein
MMGVPPFDPIISEHSRKKWSDDTAFAEKFALYFVYNFWTHSLYSPNNPLSI